MAHVSSTNMEEAGLMTCTAANQQGAIEMFWLHFRGALRMSVYYRVYESILLSCIYGKYVAGATTVSIAQKLETGKSLALSTGNKITLSAC